MEPSLGIGERKLLLDWGGGMPISAQAEILGTSCSAECYKPKQPSAGGLAAKAAIGRIYTQHPKFGSRRMSKRLQAPTTWMRGGTWPGPTCVKWGLKPYTPEGSRT